MSLKSIRLIAWNTVRELLAKKTVYFLLFVVLFVTATQGASFFFIFEKSADADPLALLARKASVLSNMLSTWSSLTILVAIIFSSGLIRNEKKNKTILGMMAKPVKRWEFLLGKWGGVLLFFYGFFVIGLAIALFFMIYWGTPMTGLFWTGVAYYIFRIFVFTAISFVLGIFMSPIMGGGIAFLLWQLGSVFELMMKSSKVILEYLGYALYYLSPAVIKESLIQKGILNNLLAPHWGLYWSVMAENFLYGALLFWLGVLLFKKRDIILG